MEYSEIKLNYRELSHISDISSERAKQIFCNELGTDKVKLKDFLLVKDLKVYFIETASHDKRYDKQNELIFALTMKGLNYRKHLNDKKAIEKLKLTGGKSVYYKILAEKELEHIEAQLKQKHVFLFGLDSYNKIKGIESN
jgi:hypothetical protein